MSGFILRKRSRSSAQTSSTDSRRSDSRIHASVDDDDGDRFVADGDFYVDSDEDYDDEQSPARSSSRRGGGRRSGTRRIMTERNTAHAKQFFNTLERGYGTGARQKAVAGLLPTLVVNRKNMGEEQAKN